MGVWESVYERSPIAVQNLMATGQGIKFRLRRYDDRLVQANLNELLKSQWWSLDQLHDLQLRRLKAHLETVFQHVPYYRALGKSLDFQPADIRTLDDLQRLPILEKQQVRGNEPQFTNETTDLRRVNRGNTSGTTGTPLHLLESRATWSRRLSYVCRLRVWSGLTEVVHPRRAQITGRDIIPLTQPSNHHVWWRYNWADNALLLSSSRMSPEAVPHYLAAIRKFNPVLLDGYPSTMLVLARVGRQSGAPMPQFKTIISTAETLFDSDKAELEEAFGAQVFNQYASSETSCFWSTCEHGTMHMNSEFGISEILKPDGTPAQPGETGEVVTTAFVNDVLPLVRYRLGDSAVAGPLDPCPCGRHLPRVERVTGRTEDMYYFPGKGYVSLIERAFKTLDGIVEAQGVQTALDHLEVRLVPDATFTPEIREQLLVNLHRYCGDQVTVTIKLVDSIPRGPNGKFNAQVSEVKHLYPGRAAD